MPQYKEHQFLKAIKGCRGYYKVIAQRLGCSRNTVTDRLKASVKLTAAMEEEMDRKGDDAEMLLEQMMAERIPVVATVLKVSKKTGKEHIVREQRQVFSRSAAAALIFYHKTKLRKRGYIEVRGNIDVNENQDSIDEQLKAIADKMRVK